MTRDDFATLAQRHRRGLVRLARWFDARDPEDAVAVAIARILDRGEYLKFDLDPDAVRAPAWMRKTLDYTIKDMRRREARRRPLARDAAREDLTVRGLSVSVHGDTDLDELPELQVGGAERDGWALLDSMIQYEELGVAWDALAALAPDVYQAALEHFGHGKPWPSEATRKKVTRALKKIRAHVSGYADQ